MPDDLPTLRPVAVLQALLDRHDVWRRRVAGAGLDVLPAGGVVAGDRSWAEDVVDDSDVRRLAEDRFRRPGALVAPPPGRTAPHDPPSSPPAGLALTGTDQEELDGPTAALERI
ncbi:hypothetical protein ACGH2B_26675 [Streptomyces sp. BBFR2]|uniref:hypothetical protein n=1 Tax=Streptomyces sp. BBFR2 TaxID=3372854 RepID=UPI0037D9F0CC